MWFNYPGSIGLLTELRDSHRNICANKPAPLICQYCNAMLCAPNPDGEGLNVTQNSMTGCIEPTGSSVVWGAIPISKRPRVSALCYQIRFALHRFRVAACEHERNAEKKNHVSQHSKRLPVLRELIKLVPSKKPSYDVRAEGWFIGKGAGDVV